MPPVGFELTISAGERPQTYALDRATTGTVCSRMLLYQILHAYIFAGVFVCIFLVRIGAIEYEFCVKEVG